jgi:hypothetical protein
MDLVGPIHQRNQCSVKVDEKRVSGSGNARGRQKIRLLGPGKHCVIFLAIRFGRMPGIRGIGDRSGTNDAATARLFPGAPISR